MAFWPLTAILSIRWEFNTCCSMLIHLIKLGLEFIYKSSGINAIRSIDIRYMRWTFWIAITKLYSENSVLFSGQLNCQDCLSVSFLPKFFSLISPIIYTYLDILPLSIYILYLNQIREEKKRFFSHFRAPLPLGIQFSSTSRCREMGPGLFKSQSLWYWEWNHRCRLNSRVRS